LIFQKNVKGGTIYSGNFKFLCQYTPQRIICKAEHMLKRIFSNKKKLRTGLCVECRWKNKNEHRMNQNALSLGRPWRME